MTGIKEWLFGWIWDKVKSKSPSDYVLMQQFFRENIDVRDKLFEDRMKLLEEQLKDKERVIETFRHKHENNGEELSGWKEDLNLAYQEIYRMEGLILELRTLISVYEQIDKFNEQKKKK